MGTVIFTNQDTAVENYRLFRPLDGLKNKTYVTKFDGGFLKEIAERWKKLGDVWVVKYISSEFIKVILSARKLVDVKLVVDIDDNIWSIPKGNVANTYYDFLKMEATAYLVNQADWVTVSTKPLKALVEPANKNVVVIPNVIKPHEWGEREGGNKKLRIGWVYSKTHRPDIKPVKEALEEFFNPTKMEFILLGGEPKVFDFKYQIRKGVPYREYPQRLVDANLDISIAPLEDNDFNQCKSNIKWLESTMAGSAVIASDVYPYTSSIKNGITGLLAKDKRDWLANFKMLEDKSYRDELVHNARVEVLKKYNIDKKQDFINFLKSL